MKKGKIVFLVFASLWAVLLVVSAFTAKNYPLGARIIVILMAILPLGIYSIVKFLSQKNQNKYNNRSIDLSRNINSSSSSSSNIKNFQNQNYNGNDISNVATKTEKKDNQSTTYVHQENMIVRSDEKPITDEEIPNLIALGYQDSIKKEKESTNIIFHRTEQEEELSIQFMVNHGGEMDLRCEAFEKCYDEALQVNSIDKKIELCEKAISLFEKAKKFAYRTKGGMIYFQDMYEHLHNANNPDFSYNDMLNDEINKLIKERDYIIPNLKNIILNNNGILQKNIYQYLPDIPEYEIQKTLKDLESQNIISRTKKGTSYTLELIQ